MISLFEQHKELLADEAKALAFLATLMPDGSPQVTPVWFTTDGEHILVNSAVGRVKDKNMRARPEVAVTIMDLSDSYNYMLVRGKVVEITEDGAVEHINSLAKKYMDREDYGVPASETRVLYKIKPN